MSDARNVYIILFVMLLLPIVFYMLRRRYRTHDTKKKMRCLVYMVVMIIAPAEHALACIAIRSYGAAFGGGEWRRCIRRRRWAGSSGCERKRAVEESGQVQQLGTGNWADFAGASIEMPDKNIELENGKYYPIVLEKQDARLCLAMKITQNKTHTKVSDIVVLWPEEIGEKLDSVTFFESGNLPQ
ncbi:MAG: hypothetical protein ACLUO4_09330 [Christensenellales bacterium]